MKESLAGGVGADGAEAEDGGDFVAVGGLEADGYFLFALDEGRGNGVLDIFIARERRDSVGY